MVLVSMFECAATTGQKSEKVSENSRPSFSEENVDSGCTLMRPVWYSSLRICIATDMSPGLMPVLQLCSGKPTTQ